MENWYKIAKSNYQEEKSEFNKAFKSTAISITKHLLKDKVGIIKFSNGLEITLNLKNDSKDSGTFEIKS